MWNCFVQRGIGAGRGRPDKVRSASGLPRNLRSAGIAGAEQRPAGLSLIELLLVVAVLAVLVGLILPDANAPMPDRLRAAARVLASDLAYARSLAVANNSRYRVRFEPAENRYIIEHSGTNPALDTLPPWPFGKPGDPSDQQIVDFDELPQVGAAVRLLGAVVESGTTQKVSEVEFDCLGQTTRSGTTVIWLGAGEGADRRYISVQVNPATGLATRGECTTEGLPAALKPTGI